MVWTQILRIAIVTMGSEHQFLAACESRTDVIPGECQMDVQLSRAALLRGIAGTAAATYLTLRGEPSVGAAQESADERAIAALENDDTEGAVEIWEAEFKRRPFDDDVRQALQASLVVHAMRCLDKGELVDAKAAVKRAKEVIPSSPAYRYLDEALTSYAKVLYRDDMKTKTGFLADSNTQSESRYAEIPGLFGNQTQVLAITEKKPGYLVYYDLADIPRSETEQVAIRMLAYPMSDGGDVTIQFGKTTDHNLFAFTINTFPLYGVTWFLSEMQNSVWLDSIASGGQPFEEKNWHALEVRIRGQSIEVWLDYLLVSEEVILELEVGGLAFGVGLASDAVGTTFSAAFDDLVVYSLR